MAFKQVFITGNEKHLFFHKMIEYKYYGGFAVSQRQKCVESLHHSIHRSWPEAQVLEISSKSLTDLGKALSAFNLLTHCPALGRSIPVECVFQGSKVFEQGGPYTDLLEATARQAKKDERLRSSGRLIGFEYQGVSYPTQPLTLFYDWVYLHALAQNPQLADRLPAYTFFTDIEFNQEKSINCQARTAAIYTTLRATGRLEQALNDLDCLKSLYK